MALKTLSFTASVISSILLSLCIPSRRRRAEDIFAVSFPFEEDDEPSIASWVGESDPEFLPPRPSLALVNDLAEPRKLLQTPSILSPTRSIRTSQADDPEPSVNVEIHLKSEFRVERMLDDSGDV